MNLLELAADYWWLYLFMTLLTYQSLLSMVYLPDSGDRTACALLAPLWPYLFALAVVKKILS